MNPGVKIDTKHVTGNAGTQKRRKLETWQKKTNSIQNLIRWGKNLQAYRTGVPLGIETNSTKHNLTSVEREEKKYQNDGINRTTPKKQSNPL